MTDDSAATSSAADMSRDEFRSLARSFVTLNDEIKETDQAIKVVKDKRKQMRAQLLEWMEANRVSKVTIPDNRQLGPNERPKPPTVLKRKRTCTRKMNAKVIQDAIRAELKLTDDESVDIAQRIWDNREVVERETLSCTAPKKRKLNDE